MERTMLALFDYSKAFDTVRRSALLKKMGEMGVPERFRRWVRGWLVNRTARVRVEEDRSRRRVMREGLPQGAAISPLLFIIFINDLLGLFEPDTLVSAFADDLALACSDRYRGTAQERMQREVVKVEEWSVKWGLQLNVEKCESFLFSTDTSEASWKPELTLLGGAIKGSQNPVFLGVKYDTHMTFNRHAEEVARKMVGRTAMEH
jgi:hypothetical protein